VGSVKKLPNGKYRARYWGPDGRQRCRHFDLKRDADRWVASNETARDRCEWLDPDRGRMTVAEWLRIWAATKARLRPKTRVAYESVVDRWVLPRWGPVPLNRITHAGVVEWVADISTQVGPATSAKALLAAMTLDVYAGLFDEELDEVADRMGSAAEAAGTVNRVSTE
jgi:hypothetical protein